MTRERGLMKKEPQSLVQSERRPVIAPACDIYESDEELLVVADLPGVKTEGLRLDVDKGELTMEAHREVAVEGNRVTEELRDCDFRRRFLVPAGIDGARIEAELKDGVLRLHLPKSAQLKPRQIAVRAG